MGAAFRCKPPRAALRTALSATLILGAVLASGAAAQEQPDTAARVIVVGGDFRYEPYEWLDEGGRPRGFHIDLMRAIGEAMGFEVRFRLDTWDEVRRALEQGEIDVVPMFRSPERDRLVDFAEPHAVLEHQLFVRAGAPAIHSLTDLRGRTVIVQRGSYAHDRLRELDTGARIILVATEVGGMRLLASGQHDAALVTRLGGHRTMQQERLSNVVATGPLLWPAEYCLSVTEGNSELLERLDEGLATLKATGRYDELYHHWFDRVREGRVPLTVALRYAAWVLLPLLAVALAALGWTWTLRRQVAARTSALKREIAQRKGVETTLRQTREWAESLLENALDVVLVVEPSGTIVYASPSVEPVLGHRPADLQGTSAFELVHPEDLPGVTAALQRVASAPGHAETVQTRVRRRDGRWRVHEAVGRLLPPDAPVPGVLVNSRDITDREEAQEELRVSEERFRLLFEFAPDAYYLNDLKGEFVDGNRAAEALTGYRRKELIGRSFMELNLLSASQLPKAAAALAKNAVGQPTGPDEFVLTRKDGSQVTVEIRTLPIQIEGRRLVLGIARDITDRREAEAASRLQSVALGAADNAIMITDREGTITWVNPAFTKLTGYRAKEVIGKNPRFLKSGVHDAAFYKKMWDRILAGRAWRGELVNRRKDGSLYHEEQTITPVHDERGRTTHFVSVREDITERKESERLLRQSEAHYRTLVSNATYGIYQSTAEGRFRSVNPALVDMLGYDSEDELLAVDLTRDVYADASVRQRLIAEYEGRGEVRDCEVDWKRKSGQKLTVRLSGRPIADESGNLLWFEMIAEDVTARRSLEQQLRQAQKMEAVGRLAGGVAHDFNNLLTVMLAETDIALDGAGEAAAREPLEEIRRAAERASVLTRQLLTFSRRQLVEPTVFGVNDLVGEMDKLLRRLIGEDVLLTTRLAPDAGAVRADHGQIEQVVVNLAVNARDAMPQGGSLVLETGNVTLDAEYARVHAGVSPGEYVLIALSDTGSGMSEEVKAHVFEPFFTTKPAGRGTGLGLATCYGIVRQAGGHIGVYSEAGVGTTMKVYLPLVTAEVAGRREEAGALATGSETILLVEDEPAVRSVTVRLLTRLGYTVLEAPDGVAALDLLDAHAEPVQLLLTDVVLPHMGGRQLAQEVTARAPEIRVLFTSGYTDDVILQHQLVEGDVALLQKPFTLEALASKVREVLDRAA